MRLFGFDLSRAERRAAPIDTIASSATAEEMFAFFGLQRGDLPVVTTETALQLPPMLSAIDFLSSCMAAVPRHAYRVTKVDGKDQIEQVGGKLQRIINEAPNPNWSSFDFWKYLWTQRFTGGRALAWIERSAGSIVALWPIDPTKTTVKRIGTRKVYEFMGGGRSQVYEASEVIDLPFLLKADQLGSYSPIRLGEKAIQRGLALMDFSAGFFAGGGVPPYALEGPLPKGHEAMNRAAEQIERAIKLARREGRPFFGMPPGHKLTPIGVDPEKGQMVEAMGQVVLDIARIFRLPPVFLQDLTHGTFTNTEQQDLQIVKHLIAQLARQCEDELNLKLFGADKNTRYVEHNLDGLQRGDFKSRIEALAKGVTSALLTPDEARALENRPPINGGDRGYIQGAMVPLEMAGTPEAKAAAAASGASNQNGDPTGAAGQDE